MKIGSQIVIGFIIISLLLATTAWISDRTTQNIREEQIEYVKETTQIVSLTSDMERKLYQSLVALNVVREWNEINSEDNRAIQRLPSKVSQIQKFESSIAEFKRSSAQVQDLIEQNGVIPDGFRDLNEKVRFYESLALEWLKLSNEEVDQATLMFLNSIQPYFLDNIIPYIQNVQEYSINVQNERNNNLDLNLQKARQWYVFFIGLTFIIACIVAFYFYRFIARKLQRLSESVQKVGEGDLTVRAKVPSNDEIGELAASFNQMIENLEQKTVSRQYLDNIIESMDEALFVTDPEGRIKKVNAAACTMLGYTEPELEGMELQKLLSNGAENTENLDAYISQEIDLRKVDGETIPVAISTSTLKTLEDNSIGNILVATDITERIEKEAQIRESLHEKEILLAEIHHRVKNNLAVISGLLQLQSFSEANEEVAQALLDSQTRIKSIALIHEMLYQNESLAYIRYDTYIKDLLDALRDMHDYADKDINIMTELETLSLNINQAIPCSLILNELITNAFKHAFKDTNQGFIKVKMHIQGEKLVLLIEDSGKGFKMEKDKKKRSLGFTLINTLTDQLQGKFDLVNKEGEGTRFRLEFQKEN
ncbi:histidine kinase dimerization/phosphoacceptor domain -containing protein [Balneola sp. MJW-20]|uniref:histidine kinase dimerization/phosphoacceptor domain -containing protein n=1 Tax=Gracilimonas aurantiaca TaxID=3234185 RepID=UPI003467BAA5